MTDTVGTGPLAGRIAIVTGASRGIGAATAQLLAAQGAHVLLTARKVKDLEAVEEAIFAAGGSATIAPMDLTESDSIVRGTTSLQIVQMMRDAGAAEVHFRVASPPTGYGCYYGVDTPERAKLLAGRMDLAAMREFIQADSLAFVSIDGLYRAVGLAGRDNANPQYCDACFTGEYPTTLTDINDQHRAQGQLAFPIGKVA